MPVFRKMENSCPQWDVAIIGAGPAGLFAAYELVARKPGIRILIIDRGKEALARRCPVSDKNLSCVNCRPCNIIAALAARAYFLTEF